MLGGRSDSQLVEELGAAVTAIHPGLDWEFTAGTSSQHLLVVSAVGDPELRSLAEQWRRAGPGPDQVFGYASARPGRPDALDSGLVFDGHDLDLADTRFAAAHDAERDCVDVRVWHPAFPTLPEGARRQITFLILDWLLGEDTVEIWIGGIETCVEAGPSLTGRALAELVAEAGPGDGTPRWRTMSGTVAGKPVVALAQTRLIPARWPGYDVHIRMDVPYPRRDENGLPAKATLAALYALDDHVVEHADTVVLVAHETSNGVRTTHFYADRPTAADALKPLVASWEHGRVKITATRDPHWEQVRHLR